MEFRLLGPIEAVVGDRPLALGSPRQRAVLAMLALAAPEVVSTDRFVDGLWGEDPPANPLAALQVFVHGLRKALKDGGDDLVVREAPGYRLAITPDRTDIGDVISLQRAAHAAREAGDLATARTALASARARWRGQALADVRTTPFAGPEAVRLDELRLQIDEDAFDVSLALGDHASLIDPLTSAVHDHPMRERFWGQLMTALYRSERQADALATYARAREQLADELGIDPGQALQQLELAILRQDPAIAAPSPLLGGTGGTPAVVVPRTSTRVPRPTTPTFGRDELVDRLTTMLTGEGIRAVTLTGPGGAGKSRVAALAALAVADRMEVVHLSLTELTSPEQVAAEAALALSGTDDLDALGDRDATALLVLDNLESVAGADRLVTDLLEHAAGLTILSTSRLPLRIRAEHDVPVPPLPAPPIGADPEAVADSPAVQMFLDRAFAVAPDGDHERHLDDIAELCRFLDGYPLALELAAAQTRMMTPAAVRAALDQDLDLLQARGADVPERQRTLTATIEWSYDQLSPPAQSVADRLALFERSFTVESLEAVCTDVDDVLGALGQLVEARLVRPAPSRVEVRFTAIGTIRAFTRNRLDARPDREVVRAALAAHLRSRAAEWNRSIDGAEAAATAGRYDDTAADLDGILDAAVRRGDAAEAVELTELLTDLWIATGRLTEALRRLGEVAALPLTAAQAARIDLAIAKLAYQQTDWDRAADHCRRALASGADPTTEAAARCYLGGALVVTGAVEEGVASATTALAAAEARGDYRTTAVALSILAIGCAVRGDFDGERAHYERRLTVVTARGDAARIADTLNTLAEIALDDDDAATARAYAEESIGIAGEVLPLERRDATITLARAAAVESDVPAVTQHLETALVLTDRTGQSLALAQCLRVGGCLAVLEGQAGSAVRLFAAAHALSPSPSGTDEPIEADLAGRLAAARDALGEQAAGREWTLGRTLPLAAARRTLADLLTAASGALSAH